MRLMATRWPRTVHVMALVPVFAALCRSYIQESLLIEGTLSPPSLLLFARQVFGEDYSQPLSPSRRFIEERLVQARLLWEAIQYTAAPLSGFLFPSPGLTDGPGQFLPHRIVRADFPAVAYKGTTILLEVKKLLKLLLIKLLIWLKYQGLCPRYGDVGLQLLPPFLL